MFQDSISRPKRLSFAEILEEKTAEPRAAGGVETHSARMTTDPIRDVLDWLSRVTPTFVGPSQNVIRQKYPQSPKTAIQQKPPISTPTSPPVSFAHPQAHMAQQVFEKLGEAQVCEGILESELKQIYRKWAKRLHPDMLKSAAADEKRRKMRLFQEVTWAYETLTRPLGP